MTDLELRQIDFAARFGLALNDYKRLASALNAEHLTWVLELLKVKKYKSKNRARCASDVHAWLKNPVGLKPLTRGQLASIKPSWPIDFHLPT